MKVVISGYYGFHNIGDEAILQAIIQQLRDLDPDIQITVLSGDPADTRKKYDVNAVHRFQFLKIRRELKEADGLISGGGSLMQDVTGLKSIPYYCGVIQLAKRYGTPVFVYAQGIGPVVRPFSQRLLASTFRTADVITVRDQRSLELLREVGVEKPIDVTADAVFAMNVADLSGSDGDYIVVSVRPWAEDTRYQVELARALDQMDQPVVFVPMQGDADYKASVTVRNHMERSDEVTIMDVDSTLDERIAMIGRAKMMVGMRLHALIFAALMKTPFVALSYDPKIDAFAGERVVGHVERHDWDSDELVRAFNVYEGDIMDISHYREQAQATAQHALELFSR